MFMAVRCWQVDFVVSSFLTGGFCLLSPENPAEADLWLLNSCTVKNPAEDHFRNSIRLGPPPAELCPGLVCHKRG